MLKMETIPMFSDSKSTNEKLTTNRYKHENKCVKTDNELVLKNDGLCKVAQAYNISYSRGGNCEDGGSRQA
jgi:hypothetical protein